MSKELKEEHIGIGRRKTAVASVRLRSTSNGTIKVNGKSFEDYFPLELHKVAIEAPMRIIDLNISRYGIFIRVKGGGKEAQMDAIQLGIARALVLEQGDRRSSLKSAGFLKRDPRKKERKKYGLRGARRGFQFSKR